MIESGTGLSLDEIADAEQLHFSRVAVSSSEQQPVDPSNADISSASSSVSFDCPLSSRETLGTAELGEELFAVFERCHSAGMSKREISIAIGRPEDQLSHLYAQLKAVSKPKKIGVPKKKRVRVVRISQKDNDQGTPKDEFRDLELKETYVYKKATGLLSYVFFFLVYYILI